VVDRDHVAAVQLAAAACVDLAVDADLALRDELAGLGARLGEAGELEELPEADDVVGDLDRAGVVGGVHATHSPRPRGVGATRRPAARAVRPVGETPRRGVARAPRLDP
jgi:hypothetical protein